VRKLRGSIQKKGDIYYVVFRVPDPKSGKLKQKWISAGKTKKGADLKLTELVGEVNNGTYREIEKITFSKFVGLWLSSYAKSRCKPSTYKSYENIIYKHLIPVMGDYYLTELTTGRLQMYVAMRLKKVKPKTVINELVVIKRMFKHAVLWGYLKINYAEYVERPRVEKEEMKILTPEKINILLENITPKYKLFFLTAILTGMRRGELVGLQWKDIDWENSQIHVKRAFCSVSKDFISPKSRASVRRIDISPRLVRELKRYRLSCPQSNYDLVFCTSKGTPIDANSLVRRKYLPALKRAGLGHVRFHDLRHTNVAFRIEQGQNIKYIQSQVGHASIQTTLDRYGHLINDVNTDQAEKLDEILLGARRKTDADVLKVFTKVEDSGNGSNSVRRMLEDSDKKRDTQNVTPCNCW
jgi:integrase